MQRKLDSFSLWCDFIERNFIKDNFSKLLENPFINGATSNPSIFKEAILNSPAYKDDIKNLKDKSPKEKYESLALKDIKEASSVLMKLYLKDNDGFISIEVDPSLKNDTKATIKEGKRLYSELSSENVMIKIPATNAGYEAMEELLSIGININATLVFSPEQADKCLKAFENANKKFQENFLDKKLPKAVISVFVSRFDKKLESSLKRLNRAVFKVGIMNASLIYKNIEKKALPNVRCLFASTGVKSKDLKPDFYIQELLYPNSINTAPIVAIEDFLKNKNPSYKKIPSDTVIKEYFEDLKDCGIDMQTIYDELLDEGLVAFCKSFDEIMQALK